MALVGGTQASIAQIIQKIRDGDYLDISGPRSQLWNDIFNAYLWDTYATIDLKDIADYEPEKGRTIQDIRSEGSDWASNWLVQYEINDDWVGGTPAGLVDTKLVGGGGGDYDPLRVPSADIWGFKDGQPGQYQQFQGLLPDLPGYGGLSRFGQQAFQRQFAPMAAGFALQNIASPFAQEWGPGDYIVDRGGTSYKETGLDILPQDFYAGAQPTVDVEGNPLTSPIGQSFYNYAGSPVGGTIGAGLPSIFSGFAPGGTQGYGGQFAVGPTQQQYGDIFKALTPFFAGGQEADVLRTAATQPQRNVLNWVKDRQIAENLISQYALQGVDPMFRDIYAQNRLEPAFAQFYSDPGAQAQQGGLFGRFLQRGIGGVGGWA